MTSIFSLVCFVMDYTSLSTQTSNGLELPLHLIFKLGTKVV